MNHRNQLLTEETNELRRATEELTDKLGVATGTIEKTERELKTTKDILESVEEQSKLYVRPYSMTKPGEPATRGIQKA